MNARWVIFLVVMGMGLSAHTLQAKQQTSLVVDVSHELFEGMPTFPGGIPFRMKPVATFEQAGYFANHLELGEHTGTHIDAPIHFQADAASVDQLTPAQLVGPGVVISIASRAATNPDATVEPSGLAQWEQQHGPIPTRSFVLIHTGWSDRWPDEAAYRNADAQGLLHFPGISEEAARWLCERGIRGVGIDALSIDPGVSSTFAAHKVLARKRVVVIENLTHLEQLPPTGFTIVAAPLKIRGGSGSPARVLVILEEQGEDVDE